MRDLDIVIKAAQQAEAEMEDRASDLSRTQEYRDMAVQVVCGLNSFVWRLNRLKHDFVEEAGDPEDVNAELLEALEQVMPEYPRDATNGSLPTFAQCERARAAISNAKAALEAKGYSAKTYRKTALIQAEQYLGQSVAGVCTGGPCCASKGAPNDAVPHIHTLEGDLTVSHGDWIATGVQGEHWAIKPDVFAATYEEAVLP